MPEPWDWPEFQRDIRHLLDMSEQLHDSWTIVTHGSPVEVCTQYLCKQTKCWVNLPLSTQSAMPSPQCSDTDRTPDDSSSCPPPTSPKTLLSYEFHVLFHPSYRVPTLYFKATMPNGQPLSLDDAWRLFKSESQPNMASVITEMHHPLLSTPFLVLHPCRTDELLSGMAGSANRVLTFLSTMGPAVNLEMDVRYGMAVS